MSDKNRVTPQSSGTSRPSTVAAPARSRPSTSTSSSTSTASSISSLLASLQAARSNTTSRAPSSSAPSTSGTPTGSAGSSAAPTTAVAPANPLRESLRKTTTFGGDECIILHIGTLHARVGFAGESKPRHVFPITAPSFAKFEGNIEGSPSGRKVSISSHSVGCVSRNFF
ncbi:hypothetical protein M427DRAFT_345941 [Gonapodya prolifera JEL478]|uniref:Uncharacterized protein n=1 Tax=Gonapodya prolifera (strain JEL478) TaxID=1344416 RepID=A0A139AVQ4_GONPJ|nr:hypothetical protein M427DRAFT_345941 [Gonapodya prolifera JEL478]|eukprot:KXS20821.1 hypothetical protein M427DRAFT_345941 [Gonapodya prolifera JEL478]